MRKKWTLEKLYREVKKYKTRSKFQKGSSGAYDAARRLGILNQICKHIPKYTGANWNIKWTYKNLCKEALKYKTRSKFQKGSSGAYDAAHKKNILDSICKHMIEVRHKWTDEELRQEALKYKTRNVFAKTSTCAYQLCQQRGLLDKVCSHMPKHVDKSGKNNRNFKWTKEKLQIEALKYKTRNDFFKNSSGAYDSAINMGILNEICSDLAYLCRKPWTVFEIKNEALKYPNKTAFTKGAMGAYKAALRLNILDEVTSHMPKRGVVSKAEVSLIDEIKKKYPKAHTLRIRKKNLIKNKPHIKGFHIDIYIPELRKGIEYDGTYWHSIKGLKRSREDWPEEDLVNYHQIKDDYFKSKGIQLLHIKEEDWMEDKTKCLKNIWEFLSKEQYE